MAQGHRRKFPTALFETLPPREAKQYSRLTVILPLAIVLHRSRSKERIPAFRLSAEKENLALSFPDNWLEQHPLTLSDLEQEADYLTEAGFQLQIS